MKTVCVVGPKISILSPDILQYVGSFLILIGILNLARAQIDVILLYQYIKK
jgi:hypothetical protein